MRLPVDPKTILVVEDSPIELNMVASFLKQKGYRVCVASDGETAITMALQEQPDLIILDIVLPKKNGYQVCRHLKANPDTKEIKILLMSSKRMDSDRCWGLKQGADAYLTKPFSDQDLVNSVLNCL